MLPSTSPKTNLRATIYAAYAAIAASTIFIVLATAPGRGHLLWRMTREGGPAEWATALALAALSWVSFASWRGLRGQGRSLKWDTPLLLGLSLLALAAALEELSWGQQILGFSSYEFFLEHNLQKETNLHNLVDSRLFNTAIYAAVYLAFIYAPLTAWNFPDSRAGRLIARLKDYAPSFHTVCLLIFSCLIQAYFRWDTSFDTLAAWAALALAWRFALRGEPRDPARLTHLGLISLGAALLAARYQVYAINNYQYEIRELLTVLAALAWVADFSSRRRAKGARAG